MKSIFLKFVLCFRLLQAYLNFTIEPDPVVCSGAWSQGVLHNVMVQRQPCAKVIMEGDKRCMEQNSNGAPFFLKTFWCKCVWACLSSYVGWSYLHCTLPRRRLRRALTTGCFRKKLTLEMVHFWRNWLLYMRFPKLIFTVPKTSGQPGRFEYNYFAQLLILSEICMVQTLHLTVKKQINIHICSSVVLIFSTNRYKN